MASAQEAERVTRDHWERVLADGKMRFVCREMGWKLIWFISLVFLLRFFGIWSPVAALCSGATWVRFGGGKRRCRSMGRKSASVSPLGET